MEKLKGYQRKHLRGLAHDFKPLVLIGQKGLTDSLIESIEQALDDHELIKVKFNDFKEKGDKKEILAAIEERTECEAAGLIGHVAILYRPHRQPEKRKIRIPH